MPPVWKRRTCSTYGAEFQFGIYVFINTALLQSEKHLSFNREDAGVNKAPIAGALKKAALGGASHSAEIEYAMGNLATNGVYEWQPEDYKVSQIMQGYFVNFIKTGNPNGVALPLWPAIQKGKPVPVMIIDVNTRIETEKSRDGYLLFDAMQKSQ